MRYVSKSKRFDVLKRDHFTCQYCGGHPPFTPLEVDHIYPVSLGGDNDLLNLVTACATCNSGKGNRTHILLPHVTLAMSKKGFQAALVFRAHLPGRGLWKIYRHAAGVADAVSAERLQRAASECSNEDDLFNQLRKQIAEGGCVFHSKECTQCPRV